ncbi:threonine ammonia-lyase [Desulfuribacillus stibiiarsenatis]|uniref:threonine ammonia-lyase n=1 Tax=Desulfuribacillus stibiiarsenatis TaxID=1390249 RepID=A0A1E5L9X3_9FIRM|nr:threonine ammonia-lyase [Desulfuribacillus stibiiarsenatis]OEH86935.1 threonine ammonia-lyase [Desulfuribacillus stibiiarsenatis]
MYNKIVEAQTRIQAVAHKTPLVYSNIFSEISGCNVFLKYEHLQKTGSFKIRGSYNKISALSDEERKHGVIASSAGNHAQGVALAATKSGIPSTIVMPEGAPLAKIAATKGYGAEIVLHGQAFDDAYQKARELQQQTGATFIHAFDDEEIIAGQGTIALELLEDLQDIEAILVPIGGGGLIAGIGAAIKETHPDIQVIGVEAAGAASMYASIHDKERRALQAVNTIADGIAVKEPGEKTYQMVREYVDELVTVSDEDIARTMLILLERAKQMVEASGAAALAALVSTPNEQFRNEMKGKNVIAILSGGNVDVNLISRIIQQGLMEAGRYFRFLTSVPDRPGNLQKVIAILATLKANIISVEHFRVGTRVSLGRTEIEFVVETTNQQHIEELINSLEKEGYPLIKV